MEESLAKFLAYQFYDLLKKKGELQRVIDAAKAGHMQVDITLQIGPTTLESIRKELTRQVESQHVQENT